MSDSGSKGPSSGPRAKPVDAAGAAEAPMPSLAPAPISVDDDAHGRPSFVLASTIEGASGDRSVLSRSEAGGAVAISDADSAQQRRSRLLVLGVIVGVAILAVGIGIGIGRTGSEPTAATTTALGTASHRRGAPSRTLGAATERTAVAKPTAAPSETAAPSPAAASAMVPAFAAEAGAPAAHATVVTPPTANAGGHLRPPASAKPIVSAAPSARPHGRDAEDRSDPLF
jgi:hypothetical protein